MAAIRYERVEVTGVNNAESAAVTLVSGTDREPKILLGISCSPAVGDDDLVARIERETIVDIETTIFDPEFFLPLDHPLKEGEDLTVAIRNRDGAVGGPFDIAAQYIIPNEERPPGFPERL